MLIGCLLLLPSCDRLASAFGSAEDLSSSVKLSALQAPPAEVLTAPYPPGRWRLATPEELDQAMVWGAHILIAHRDVTPGVASFHLPEWTPASTTPQRDRREASALAERLALEARKDSSTFAGLASQYSDDVGTRDSGGSFAGISAYQLAEWPEVLDAFAALQVGEVSRVVETDYGFHVFLRYPPPAERTFSGARIVIGYDSAPWLHRFLAWRPVPSRSRVQALELANDLYAKLRQHPEDFESLMQAHSDHRDALRGGDLGQWSTREPTPIPRELEVLAQLGIGEVARPLDSPVGVEILKRTGERPRQRYAMMAIERAFDPALPDARKDSRASVLRELTELIPQLERDDAASFAKQPSGDASFFSVSWTEGRGNAVHEGALNGLAIGATVPAPLIDGSRAILLKRLQPEAEAPLRVSLELPTPAGPDVEYWLSRYGTSSLFSVLARRAKLNAEETARVVRCGERIESARSEGEALSFLAELRRELEASLGRESFASCWEAFASYLAERLTSLTPHPGHPRTVGGVPVRQWPVL